MSKIWFLNGYFSSASTVARLAFQSGRAIPKSRSKLLQSSRELAGLCAGVGYSLAGIGVTLTERPDCAKISQAKSAQLTEGLLLR